MTGEDQHERHRSDSNGTTRRSEGTDRERQTPVVGAYDAVDGVAAFVVAALDRDDAWLAVETGGERALEEWR